MKCLIREFDGICYLFHNLFIVVSVICIPITSCIIISNNALPISSSSSGSSNSSIEVVVIIVRIIYATTATSIVNAIIVDKKLTIFIISLDIHTKPQQERAW